ncbi:hypothetical protein RhiirA4_543988 [Rhizophagus irregularis]|uniref:Copper acquisition factor BIM1-like domain-containing protein n=1 Tax=Rhizophagus irregularis TaxID=588596 RepID=A0A2I1GLQ3_9GLOM|nr:hypothetical protein RhiirA4_543988 [Rhizophagus irregularis]
MWCSRIRGPFKMILEEYPGIFSNNGYIQTHANPMTLSCYAVNHLKRCINRDTILNEHAYVITLTVNNIREADGVTGPHILTYFRLCENITITFLFNMNTFKVFSVFLVLFFVLISSTNAHFSIISPPFRGRIGANMIQSPCGGFNDVNTTAITEFPLTDGQVTTRFGDGNGFMIINYAPTSNDTFQPVSENFTVFVAEGAEAKYFAIKVDLSKAGAKVGDQGVLQGFYSGATNTLYGCADIKVVNFEVIGGAAKSDNKSSGASIISTFEVVFFTTILASFIIAL